MKFYNRKKDYENTLILCNHLKLSNVSVSMPNTHNDSISAFAGNYIQECIMCPLLQLTGKQ